MDHGEIYGDEAKIWFSLLLIVLLKLQRETINVKLLCLSDLHLRSEAVVDAIDRKVLSPFLAGIVALVCEVSPDAVVVRGHCLPGPGALAFSAVTKRDPWRPAGGGYAGQS